MTLDAAIHRMLYVLDPPDDVAHEVEIALRLGACRHGRASTEDVARRCGCGRRTLSRRMRSRGIPSPGKLIAWGKLLDCMLAWSANGSTLNRIAWDRGYGSGHELSGMLHRQAGTRPTEWSGDVGELCEALHGAWAERGALS